VNFISKKHSFYSTCHLTVQVAHWERLVAGGYTLDTTTRRFVDEAEAAGLEPSQLEVVPAMGLFDVDDMIVKVGDLGGECRDRCGRFVCSTKVLGVHPWWLSMIAGRRPLSQSGDTGLGDAPVMCGQGSLRLSHHHRPFYPLPQDLEAEVSRARDKCLHGVANVELKPLLEQSKQLSSAYHKNRDPAPRAFADDRPRIKGRFDVVTQKSKRKPKGPWGT
jgi:hypothetical protein